MNISVTSLILVPPTHVRVMIGDTLLMDEDVHEINAGDDVTSYGCAIEVEGDVHEPDHVMLSFDGAAVE